MVEDKLTKLRNLLRELGSVVVAFSGGGDSTFLLKVAVEELGDKALAVTASSSTYPSQEQAEALKLASEIGARHKLIKSEELDIEGFADNPPNRCYYCKSELFTKLGKVAQEEGAAWVLDGTNFDDLNDHRPGMQAARELGVRSPLKEVGMTKAEIRAYSKQLGLPTWNKQAFACLSSRFPYGVRITKEKLSQVDRGEMLMRELGFRQFRLRHHGDIVRIEVAREQFALVLEQAERIIEELKACGFAYITMDIQGYRTGSMNETLSEGDKVYGRSESAPTAQ